VRPVPRFQPCHFLRRVLWRNRILRLGHVWGCVTLQVGNFTEEKSPWMFSEISGVAILVPIVCSKQNRTTSWRCRNSLHQYLIKMHPQVLYVWIIAKIPCMKYKPGYWRHHPVCLPLPFHISNEFIFVLFEYWGGGVHTESTRHCGHFWPIVPAPGDCEDGGEVGGMNGFGRVNRSTRENLPRRHFVHHKSHLPDPGANPGRRSGKPATNRFSYGAAFRTSYLIFTVWIFCRSRSPERHAF
jgi:hypothetical protein